MTSRKITWILFDLGNVLVGLHATGSGAQRRRSAARRTAGAALFNENGVAQAITLGKLTRRSSWGRSISGSGPPSRPANVVSRSAREFAVVFPEVPGLIPRSKGGTGWASSRTRSSATGTTS